MAQHVKDDHQVLSCRTIDRSEAPTMMTLLLFPLSGLWSSLKTSYIIWTNSSSLTGMTD